MASLSFSTDDLRFQSWKTDDLVKFINYIVGSHPDAVYGNFELKLRKGSKTAKCNGLAELRAYLIANPSWQKPDDLSITFIMSDFLAAYHKTGRPGNNTNSNIRYLNLDLRKRRVWFYMSADDVKWFKAMRTGVPDFLGSEVKEEKKDRIGLFIALWYGGCAALAIVGVITTIFLRPHFPFGMIMSFASFAGTLVGNVLASRPVIGGNKLDLTVIQGVEGHDR